MEDEPIHWGHQHSWSRDTISSWLFLSVRSAASNFLTGKENSRVRYVLCSCVVEDAAASHAKSCFLSIDWQTDASSARIPSLPSCHGSQLGTFSIQSTLCSLSFSASSSVQHCFELIRACKQLEEEILKLTWIHPNWCAPGRNPMRAPGVAFPWCS